MAVLHTAFVKSVNPGGRLYCGIDKDAAHVNGEFGFLGAYAKAQDDYNVEANQTQIKVFVAPTATQVTNGQMPVVIMQPEMMYDNSRQALTKLELMYINGNTPFTCVQLEERDKIQVTVEAFESGAQADLALEQTFVLTDGETILTKQGDAGAIPGQAGQVYFKIVNIKDAHARSARINGSTAQGNYKLYTLEVKVNH